MNLNITEKYTSSKNLSFYLNVGFCQKIFNLSQKLPLPY